ncbi:hypothetical protein SNEBB_008137 [Seison nebaliae]|nr:hypothetical protein SNEBB_008137 [Seison nebaliae]
MAKHVTEFTKKRLQFDGSMDNRTIDFDLSSYVNELSLEQNKKKNKTTTNKSTINKKNTTRNRKDEYTFLVKSKIGSENTNPLKPDTIDAIRQKKKRRTKIKKIILKEREENSKKQQKKEEEIFESFTSCLSDLLTTDQVNEEIHEVSEDLVKSSTPSSQSDTLINNDEYSNDKISGNFSDDNSKEFLQNSPDDNSEKFQRNNSNDNSKEFLQNFPDDNSEKFQRNNSNDNSKEFLQNFPDDNSKEFLQNSPDDNSNDISNEFLQENCDNFEKFKKENSNESLEKESKKLNNENSNELLEKESKKLNNENSNELLEQSKKDDRDNSDTSIGEELENEENYKDNEEKYYEENCVNLIENENVGELGRKYPIDISGINDGILSKTRFDIIGNQLKNKLVMQPMALTPDSYDYLKTINNETKFGVYNSLKNLIGRDSYIHHYVELLKEDDDIREILENVFCQNEDLLLRETLSHRYSSVYCKFILTPQAEQELFVYLNQVWGAQLRLHIKKPQNDKLKRRIVIGLRQVKNCAQRGNAKLIVIAKDIENIAMKGGLLDSISSIEKLCKEKNIPLVYAMTRNRLKKCLIKKAPISFAAVINDMGFENNHRRIVKLINENKTNHFGLINLMRMRIRMEHLHLLLSVFDYTQAQPPTTICSSSMNGPINTFSPIQPMYANLPVMMEQSNEKRIPLNQYSTILPTMGANGVIWCPYYTVSQIPNVNFL